MYGIVLKWEQSVKTFFLNFDCNIIFYVSNHWSKMASLFHRQVVRYSQNTTNLLALSMPRRVRAETLSSGSRRIKVTILQFRKIHTSHRDIFCDQCTHYCHIRVWQFLELKWRRKVAFHRTCLKLNKFQRGDWILEIRHGKGFKCFSFRFESTSFQFQHQIQRRPEIQWSWWDFLQPLTSGTSFSCTPLSVGHICN
jgi:hypothetical protein